MSILTPIPRDSKLSTIALAYRNPDDALIADLILPRVPVGTKKFDWIEYPLDSFFNIPNTRVGELSEMQSGNIKGTPRTDKCEDEGYQIDLSADDISQAAPGFDPKEQATELCANIVELAREKRVASKVFDPSLYAAGNKKDLSAGGNKRWSDLVDGKPLTDLRAGINSCIVRPNTLVFGAAAWNAVSVHPQCVKAAGNTSGEGSITREKLAELLEINEVLVGQAFGNTVKEGKTAVVQSLWGNSALAFYRNRTAGTLGGMTFGYTAEFEKRSAGSIPVALGVRGAVRVRCWETLKEVVVGVAGAFLYQNTTT